ARADDLARSLESLDALVIGLDLSYYLGRIEKLTQDCAYPAGDFEMLSKLVQKTLGLPAYTPPVLAGCGAGATLAYAALAQAPTRGHHRAAPGLRASSGLKQAYLRARNAAGLGRPPETAVRRSLADLPLLELPVPGSTGESLAVIVSGDGGWAGLDRDVASQL